MFEWLLEEFLPVIFVAMGIGFIATMIWSIYIRTLDIKDDIINWVKNR